MWSTGVIIYVALSGQFPFNEDVDIEDQIKNAHFMYPNRPWKSISKEAVNCIQNLLVVEHEARYTVDDALADLWVSDIQCKADIGRLEEEAGSQLFFKRGRINFKPENWGNFSWKQGWGWGGGVNFQERT